MAASACAKKESSRSSRGCSSSTSWLMASSRTLAAALARRSLLALLPAPLLLLLLLLLPAALLGVPMLRSSCVTPARLWLCSWDSTSICLASSVTSAYSTPPSSARVCSSCRPAPGVSWGAVRGKAARVSWVRLRLAALPPAPEAAPGALPPAPPPPAPLGMGYTTSTVSMSSSSSSLLSLSPVPLSPP